MVITLPFPMLGDRLSARAEAKEKARLEEAERVRREKAERRHFGGGGGGGSDRTYWATGTYDPDRYYEFHNSHSSESRGYVQDNYGSLDTYESPTAPTDQHKSLTKEHNMNWLHQAAAAVGAGGPQH